LASFCLLLFLSPVTPCILPLSLHDALPISVTPWPTCCSAPSRAAACRRRGRRPSPTPRSRRWRRTRRAGCTTRRASSSATAPGRSEEHTSELQSRENLVCRLLLEKKKKQQT